MIESIAVAAASPPLQPSSDPSASPAPSPASGPSKPAASQPVARLYVQDDGAGGFVYQLVDVITGRTLAEVPRERVGDLKDAPGYTAGALVSTRA